MPLSICDADGTHRTTTKSKLKQIIFSGIDDTFVLGSSSDQRKDILLVDTMALMNTITKVPTTYFALAKNFIDIIPKSYKQVGIIADKF